MKYDELKSRHIVTNERSAASPGFRIMGSAYFSAKDQIYTLYLRILPGVPYYVVKNWSEFPEYIVFSGRAKRDNGKNRYFNRIGSGFERLSEKLIEVVLPDLNLTLYINLDAADWHLAEAKKAA